MSNNIPKVFISYSWDDDNHQSWVLNFTNELRKNGIDPKMDIVESQNKTVNFYSLMIDGIHNNDFVIIILTEQYANKANSRSGGVGFETVQLMSIIQNNLEKIVLVSPYNNDINTITPKYLLGTKVYDLSEMKYEEEFQKLLYHLHNQPYLELSPIGDKPKLEPKITFNDNENKVKIPNLKRYTELDKEKFLKDGFDKIINNLCNILKQCADANENFKYENSEEGKFKRYISIWLDDKVVKKIKIWFMKNHLIADFGIYISYPTSDYYDDDNVFNKWIICEITSDNSLSFNYTSNSFNSEKYENWQDISLDIWKNDISICLKQL